MGSWGGTCQIIEVRFRRFVSDAALPEAGEGHAPLEFAAVFADEERHVLTLNELEVLRENFGECCFTSGFAGDPVILWGEFFQPGERGCKDEVTIGFHKRGGMFQET